MGFTSRFRTALTITIAAISLAGAAGCQMSKSSNPLSPTVAGPIAGVVITTPIGVEPGQDWQIRLRDQPIKLMIQNADTSGVRTLSYTFEVASDAAFNQIVYKKTGVSAGNVTTTLQLPDALPSGRTYWWRARAEDGANTGNYSKVVSFSAVAPVVLGTPNVVSPSGTIPTATPAFQISSGGKSGPYEHVIWTLQVANDAGFSSIAAVFVADENGGQKTINENYTFLNNKTYFWRVQAKDIGDSQAVSNWSAVLSFTTAVPAPTPPPPSGGGAVGNWQQCSVYTGDPGRLSQCVHDAVNPGQGAEAAFEVTKRIAWLLRGQGAGELIKNGGENIVSWKGYSFAAGRICYPDGHIYKVLTDVGGGNGAGWADNGFVDPSLYVPAINPGS